MQNLLSEIFRIAPRTLALKEPPGGETGFFQIDDLTVWGAAGGNPVASRFSEAPLCHDWLTRNGDGTLKSSFSPTAVARALRHEHYAEEQVNFGNVQRLYYMFRPWLPVAARLPMQRIRLRGWHKTSFPRWPVDTTVEELVRLVLVASMREAGITRVPFVWFWPEGLPTCTIMTHDVETARGLNTIEEILDLDADHGIRSSAHLICQGRYRAPGSLVERLHDRGVEVNVHGFNHDGRLFTGEALFEKRARTINEYAGELGARGFRSPVMYRRAEWIDRLHVEYDMSFPNVAHLDPQQGGCCTIFPYRLGKVLELPLTTTQDYALFNLIGDYSTRTWRRQIDTIRSYNGLLSFNTHPDYLQSSNRRAVYSQLLRDLRALVDQGETWMALPGQLNDWWREREQLTVVGEGSQARIEPYSERARVAWATVEEDGLRYEIEDRSLVSS